MQVCRESLAGTARGKTHRSPTSRSLSPESGVKSIHTQIPDRDLILERGSLTEYART